MAMTNSTSRNDYIKEIRRDYRKARLAHDRKRMTSLLDDAVRYSGMHRKHLIRRFNDYRRTPIVVIARDSRHTKGRKPTYRSAEFVDALLKCWRATNCSCADNLQPYIPNLVAQLERCGELRVTSDVRALLLAVSTSTVSRVLKGHRTKDKLPIGIGTTQPGAVIKSQVAVRKGRWEETRPGCLEIDTVAHCGQANTGTYIHSYNFVDIATSWSEQGACMGMGERATVAILQAVRERLPFTVVGIDSDNGAEFLNWHLHRYCQSENLTFTRSRPYQKNDNAHVEQKNNTAIRKMVGYARYDTVEQLAILNELYNGPLRLYLNFCQPTRKRKVRYVDTTTGKVRKAYFEAKTPYQRLMASEHIDKATKQLLQSQYNNINPVKLLAEIRSLVDKLDKTVR